MPLKVTNLRLPVEATESTLTDHIADRLGMPVSDLGRWTILRKSLDARSRHDLEFVYSTVVELADSSISPDRFEHVEGVTPYKAVPFDDPDPGPEGMQDRPVIVGTGPAGLLAGFYLAKRGYRPLLLERGEPVKERVPAIRRFDF